MSFDPFGRSDDLAKLASEGYELELTQGGHLLVKGIPYRTPAGTTDRGVIVSKVEMNGDITVKPVQDHTARFIGQTPCNGLGEPLKPIIGSGSQELEPGLFADHHLSRKLPDGSPYPDYHAKVTAYAGTISGPAKALDPTIDGRTGGPCIVRNDDWPFEYVDTASGRAGIGAINGKLSASKIAIVGLGGTGSYILDLVAKCPVGEIHLFDADKFSTHNAFRSPGAACLDQLRLGMAKVDYLREMYSRMKRRIVAHPYNIDSSNATELNVMSFVFLAMEGGSAKREIAESLEAAGIVFVDCSLGVIKPKTSDRLLAHININGSTLQDRQSLYRNVDFGELDDEDDPYSENIQIAELNSINAALAVVWWKKQAGFYHERTASHHQRLNVAFNRLTSE